MDLAKLLSLLQGAQEGSEYLDYAIQRVLFRMAKPVPLYTRSLDAALSLLPEWTQWCIAQSGLNGDFAARSRTAALTEAAALTDEETHDPAAEQNEAPFRRQE